MNKLKNQIERIKRQAKCLCRFANIIKTVYILIALMLAAYLITIVESNTRHTGQALGLINSPRITKPSDF